MAPHLNWLVYGTGAIGTYIGGSLLLHGERVVFLEQPDSASALWEHGLKLNLAGQDYRILHPEVFSSITAALSFSAYDVIIFALKSFDTQAAIDSMRPFSRELPSVLCLQNGVENEALLATLLGKERVISGTVTSSVSRQGIGEIILERKRGIGISTGHPLSEKITRVLTDAQLNARLQNKSLPMKWSKMLTNLLANASSAILDMPPSEILSQPLLYKVEVEQIREALDVMHALNLEVTNLPGVAVRLFAWTVKNLSPNISRTVVSRIAGGGRGEKMPSFYIDLHSGRGNSEVDYLNGAVVRFGQQTGIQTPVNHWLNQTLKGLIKGEISSDEFTKKTDKFVRTIYLSEEMD